MVMAEDEIALAVGAFQADAPRWQEMARALRTRLDAQFERRAVLIQVRVKSAESLRAKLKKQRQFSMVDGRLEPLPVDLVGARIVVERPSDLEVVIAGLKQLREEPPVRDERRGKVDGYEATHLELLVDEALLGIPCEPTWVEVQVAAFTSHLCNSIIHELSYKKARGSPSPAEQSLIRVLRAQVKAMDQTILELWAQVDRRTKRSDRLIGSADDLRERVQAWMGTEEPLTGDFDLLFALLKGVADVSFTHAGLDQWLHGVSVPKKREYKHDVARAVWDVLQASFPAEAVEPWLRAYDSESPLKAYILNRGRAS
jgi:ppGpp synthetase/RelA/SpoT-type nucleotidyltranferase